MDDIPILKVTGVYDNKKTAEGMRTGWGLSLLLTTPKDKILFDVGADQEIFSHNLQELNIALDTVTSVVLSHPHCDHVGGLAVVLRANPNLTVYVPDSLPQFKERELSSFGINSVCSAEPHKISDYVYTSGRLHGDYRGTAIGEQNLITESKKGPVVVVGCSHPGITTILERAIEITGEAPYLVMGGFHLFSKSKQELNQIIDQFIQKSVKKVAPMHCTGKDAETLLKQRFGENYLDFRAGDEIEVN